jgi:hypothetical protein
MICFRRILPDGRFNLIGIVSFLEAPGFTLNLLPLPFTLIASVG